MLYTESRIVASDGETLFVRYYSRGSVPASRTVMIVHGACEHGERYDRVARLLVQQGWNVIVPDLRGHGRSGGVHMYVRDFRRYADDLRIIFDYYRCDPTRTALLGHSMGGLISARFAQSIPGRIQALVLSSPLLGVKLHLPLAVRLVAKLLGRTLSVITPRLRFHSQLDAAKTTRCPNALARKQQDTFAHTSVTVGWYIAMQQAIKRAWRESNSLDLPTVVIQAHQDCVVDPASPERRLKKVSSDDKAIRYIPEALHDLFSEPDWDRIALFVSRWLEKRIPDSRSQPDMLSTATITPDNWQREYLPTAC